VTVGAVRASNAGQLKLRDGVHGKPSRTVLGHPLEQSRREQQLLPAIAALKFSGNPGIGVIGLHEARDVRKGPPDTT